MVTEYETEGWFSRIADSIKGIFGGLAIFFLAMPIIFWNECRAVDRAQDLEFGLGSVVTAKADKVDSGNEGKLVHVVGDIKVNETLNDKTFGISANGLALDRKVEMYQWKQNVDETSKKKAGGKKVKKKEYSYEQVWSSTLLDSSKYKDAKYKNSNPGTMPYKSESTNAKNASLGAYKLTSSTMSGLGQSEQLEITKDDLKGMPANVQKTAKLEDGGIYLGNDPLKPQIGDIRITFSVRKPTTATVIGGQYGQELKAFTHKKLNDPLVLTTNGSKTPAEMFQDAQDSNTMLTWVIRLVTFLMMFGGLAAVFKPLSVIADLIPFIGSIVGTATSIIAFLISAPVWLLCVAAAWIVARPLVGILLLVGAGLLIGGLVFAAITFNKKRQASPA